MIRRSNLGDGFRRPLPAPTRILASKQRGRATVKKALAAPKSPKASVPWRRSGLLALTFTFLAGLVAYLASPTRQSATSAPKPPPTPARTPDFSQLPDEMKKGGWAEIKPPKHALASFDAPAGDPEVLEALAARKPISEIIDNLKKRLAAVRAPIVLMPGVARDFTNSEDLSLVQVAGFPEQTFVLPLDSYRGISAYLNRRSPSGNYAVLFNGQVDGSFRMEVARASQLERRVLPPRSEFLGFASQFPNSPTEPLLMISENVSMDETAVGATGNSFGGICEINRRDVSRDFVRILDSMEKTPDDVTKQNDAALTKIWAAGQAIRLQLLGNGSAETRAAILRDRVDIVTVHEGGHHYTPDFFPDLPLVMADPGEWRRLMFEPTVPIQL